MSEIIELKLDSGETVNVEFITTVDLNEIQGKRLLILTTYKHNKWICGYDDEAKKLYLLYKAPEKKKRWYDIFTSK